MNYSKMNKESLKVGKLFVALQTFVIFVTGSKFLLENAQKMSTVVILELIDTIESFLALLTLVLDISV